MRQHQRANLSRLRGRNNTGAEGSGQAICSPPGGAALRGIAAGALATALLSLLSRAVPGVWDRPVPGRQEPPGALPADPYDPVQVRRWQERAQSPAAYRSRGSAPLPARRQQGLPGPSLVQPQSPGPEGLAEQFAFKVGSGLFDRDISGSVKAAGLSTHFAYGSAWGALFGLLPIGRRLPPGLAGGLYGLAVWAVGPGFLAPAMKLMGKPSEEPAPRTAFTIAGHIAYGMALAHAFHAMERSVREQRDD